MIHYYQIELTRGQVARVSAEDFESLSKFRWDVRWKPRSKNYYAVRNFIRKDGELSLIGMHRQVMGSPVGMMVDHVNGDTLDNRRSNLRVATRSQNGCNSKTRSSSVSGLKGVRQHSKTGRWRAAIRKDGVQIHLGYFATPEGAHAAYCEAAKKYHGKFARIA